MTSLSKPELEALQKALPHMSAQEKAELLADLEEREKRLLDKVAEDQENRQKEHEENLEKMRSYAKKARQSAEPA